MEEKKYYTPTIDEFHVGFVFEELFQEIPIKLRAYSKEERQSLPYVWKKLSLDTSHSISRITSKIKQNKVRVKYLDFEDIESLGFITRLEPDPDPNGKGFSKKNSFLYKKDLKSPLLRYPPEMNVLFIAHRKSDTLIYLTRTTYNGIDDFKILPEIHLFHGTIKNKSELIKILKQVGVYDK